MALPKAMRLKGHRTFDYIHKNSEKYYGKLMTLKIAKSNPKILISHNNINSLNNFKIAISISKKVSKKAVERNKLRRILQDSLLKISTRRITTKHIGYLLTLKLVISTMIR